MDFSDVKTFKIVIVDDNDLILKHFQILCFNLDNVILEVLPSAKHLLSRLTVTNYDLVVLDLSMPELDGVTLLDILAKSNVYSPVAIYSALDKDITNSTVEYGKLIGLNIIGSLEKPTTEVALLNLISSLNEHQTIKKYNDNIYKTFSVVELSTAVQLNQFKVYIQPKVNILSKTVIGGEFLVRWVYKGETIGPEQFVYLLERHELINDMTKIIIDEAFSFLYHNRELLNGLNFSINLTEANLQNTDIVEYIINESEFYNINPNMLTFEITESVVSRNRETTLLNLLKLRVAGFLLSIDDFGTGYSNLKKLKDLPFTEVKIDKCFVTGCHTSARCNSIVTMITSLAKELNVNIVAEGIECKEEALFLSKLGIETGQGFSYFKPILLSHFIQIVKENA